MLFNCTKESGKSIRDYTTDEEDPDIFSGDWQINEIDQKAKIGENWYKLSVGDTIHCPKGVSHYIKNIGNKDVKIVSYIFPGSWAEGFFVETSKQNNLEKRDLELIEEKFGVVYLFF